jgi:hypothetical protein
MKATGARPKTICGLTLRCYRAGIRKYVWRSDDGRIEIGEFSLTKETLYAKVDGELIRTDAKAKRFRSAEGAVKGALGVLKRLAAAP